MESKTQMEQGSCPKCGSPNLIRDEARGEVACGSCGMVVVDDIVDQGPEWRAFTQEEKRAKQRVGAPTDFSHFDKGLSTVIQGYRDASGRPLTGEAKKQMWRLRKWQYRTRMRTARHRNLVQAMNELQRLSEKLHIPSSVQKMASVIYRKALDEDLVRGRSISGIAAGALYAACRFTQTPKTLKEIVDASLRDRDEVARGYRLIVRTLKMKMPIHDPMKYVSKIAEKAGISGKVQGTAAKILREAKRKHAVMGKDPMGVAAATLYIASSKEGQKITQKELGKAADVTEVTIRNRKRELVNRLNLDFD
ncbi:MAG: transcription initiation factor IIB [Thermoproteota archaeon]